MHRFILILTLCCLSIGCSTKTVEDSPQSVEPSKASVDEPSSMANLPTVEAGAIPKVGTKSVLTNADWKKKLDGEAYHILREHGTERAFSGKYNKHYEEGAYHCAACNAPLYSSTTKFDSKTGWPSFSAPIEAGRVATKVDKSLGMARTEILCDHCGGHLGHVFNDGPQPTGERHCVNSASLTFYSAE